MRKCYIDLAFWAVLLSAVLLGCRRESLPVADDAIKFSVGQSVTFSGLQTKTGDETVELPDDESYLKTQGNKIRIWGDYKIEGENNPWVSIFEGTRATYTATGDWDYWGEGNPKYWDKNAEYRFRAVFPDTAEILDESGSGQLNISYSMREKEVNSQTVRSDYDLMVASAPSVDGATQLSSGDPVTLKFRHACAAVRFFFKDPSVKESGGAPVYNYYIKSFELQHLYTDGTLIYNGRSEERRVGKEC